MKSHAKVLGWMLAAAMALSGGAAAAAEGQSFLVKNNAALAKIVIAEKPPRLVKLAAEELQAYIRKISGAELPIGTAPDVAYPVSIFVGKSTYTDKLGVTDADLKYGAYRIKPGSGFLVLIGQDADFVPKEPYAHSPNDVERAQKDWEKLTGASWLNPMSSLYRAYDQKSGSWLQDEGGSLNAVYGFLYNLGARWYMPGDLGEIVPALADIPLPRDEQTVHPDYQVRLWLGGRADEDSRQAMIWERRIGMNASHQTLGVGTMVHGMRNVHWGEAMKREHPEYYALYGGRRDTDSKGAGYACFSSEGFFREAVAYVRAVYDIFDAPLVQFSPADGLRQCNCEGCRGLAPSDYVFRFIDKVARELYKTHPDRILLSSAYSSYRPPPAGINEFSPNLAVSMNNWGRPRFGSEDVWRQYQSAIAGWREKLAPGRILRVENHLYSGFGGVRKAQNPRVNNPVIAPRAFAKDLRAMRGISLGERNEVSRAGGGRFLAPAVDHLNYYVNARCLWDANLDIEALLAEYCTLFYGPAAAGMRTALDFAEGTLNKPGGRGMDTADRVRFVELVQAARPVAGDTVYGRRIDLLLSQLAPLDEFKRMHAEEQAATAARLNAPAAVAADAQLGGTPVVYTLRTAITGEPADIETTFTVKWDANTLIFDVTCKDPDMANLAINKNVLGGDVVVLLIETPLHAYYQLEVNPDGDVFDADREYLKLNTSWKSQATVATERGGDFWRVKVSLPIADEEAGEGDPVNFIVGNKPTRDAPWYFNVGRVRIRDKDKQTFLFSPTGSRGFHQPSKFARLVMGAQAK